MMTFADGAWEGRSRSEEEAMQGHRVVIEEGDSTTIQAVIVDSDNSFLSLTWRASAGRISQQGTQILLDSTGLQVGEYTVTAEVDDGNRTSSCSTDIIVENRSR